ncbi:hypothetical protein D9M73_66470 [compost metagenome]
MRQLRGAGAAGFRDGDDHIDLAGRHGGDHTFGQCFTQVQACLVDRNAVEHRVRPREVHKLKNTGIEFCVRCALLGMHHAIHVHKHRFARRNVALELVRGAFKRHRFAGHHDGFAAFVFAMTNTQRANAEGVAECQQAVACDQRHHGIRTLHAFVYAAHGSKYVHRFERQAARGFFELMRQHVEQHLGIALGIDVAMVGIEQLGLELGRVGQVAVVRQHQAERCVDIKRLGLVFTVGVARRRVTHLAQAHVARQRAHVACAEHITHHTLGLVHVKLAPELRDDARRVLATVLQQQQAVIDQLVNGCLANNADDSTHKFSFLLIGFPLGRFGKSAFPGGSTHCTK